MSGPETRRLFFALWPDEAQRAALAALPAMLPAGLGRPVPAANLHLTLLFLGALTAAERRAMEAVADAVAAAPFILSLDTLGHWRRPQVLWVGSSLMPPELSVLVKQLRRGVADAGVRTDSRPFEVHLTLFRKVPHAPRQWPAFTPLRWDVPGFLLLESVSTADGVRYEPLRNWPLAGRPVHCHGIL